MIFYATLSIVFGFNFWFYFYAYKCQVGYYVALISILLPFGMFSFLYLLMEAEYEEIDIVSGTSK